MSNIHKLSAENMLRVLPDVLARDKKAYALAKAAAEAIEAVTAEIPAAQIYTAIDTLPEGLLDILAHDFKVDWWDGNYTLEQKRQTLKDSWRVHRMLGTPAAVELAISAIYPDTTVSEWFEYDGKPYHFRLNIDATYETVDQAKHQRVLERVEFYKNLRSVLDGVEYYDAGATAAVYASTACIGLEIVDGGTAINYEGGVQ